MQVPPNLEFPVSPEAAAPAAGAPGERPTWRGRAATWAAGRARDLLADRLLPLVLVALYLKSRVAVCVALSPHASSLVWRDFRRFSPSLNVYFAFCLLVVGLGLFLRGARRRWYYLGLSALLAVGMLGDLWHYRGFGAFLTLDLGRQAGNLTSIGASIVSMMRPVDLLLVADLPLVAALAFGWRVRWEKVGRSALAGLVALAGATAYLARHHLRVDVAEAGARTSLFQVHFDPLMTYSRLSPVGFHLYDAWLFATENSRLSLTPEQRAAVERWYREKPPPRAEGVPHEGLLRGKNLLIIQVESLEPFVIGQRIAGQEIAPRLNALLPQALYFPNLVTQVYGGMSSDADLLVNTSVFPVRQGSTFFRFPENRYRSLPRMLEARGYATLAAHPDRGGFWNWAPALRSIGFQQVLDISAFTVDEFINIGISDGSYLRQLRPFIRALKRPFYAFTITLTSHGPYDLDRPYRELALDPALDATKLGGYFQSIRYADKHVGLLLDGLAADGLLDDTVVVVVGDHAGPHLVYRADLEAIQPQEPWWHDDLARVPLLVWAKGLEGRTIPTLGGQVDVMPTLLHLFGVPPEEYWGSAMGRNLLEPGGGHAVSSFGAFWGPEERRAHAVEALEIADLVIRSDYFARPASRPQAPSASPATAGVP